MENMSNTVKRVIDFYGLEIDQTGDLVSVRSGKGEITFRRINNTHYKLFSHRRRIVDVNKLIEMLEEL
jgi:hypothetical protein